MVKSLCRHNDNGGGQPDLDDEQLFHIFMDLDMPGVDMTNSSDALPAAAGFGRPGKAAALDAMDSEADEDGDDGKCSERGGRSRGSGGRSTRSRRRAGKAKDEVYLRSNCVFLWNVGTGRPSLYDLQGRGENTGLARGPGVSAVV